jgi:hypothetical protein
MLMNRNFLFLGAISILTAGLGGCSLLRELNAEQCQVKADCAKFGNYECSSEKVCVASAVSSAGATNGGSGSSGKGSGGGSGGTSDTTSGGQGGSPDQAECSENADCIDAHDGAPYICQRGSCVSLTLEEHCPFVIAGTDAAPTDYLTRSGKPIIFGAYVPIDVAMPESHPYTLNYRFALNEFMDGTLGGVGTPARPFVMVLCQSTNANLKRSVSHLVDTLEVPAILATLASKDLKTVFDDVSTRDRKVFLLGPFEADSALAAADDGGRMWHMLGPTTDLIPTYVPLLSQVEKYMRNVIRGSTASPYTANFKVAVVHTDLTYSSDMANALPSEVTVNGATLNSKDNKENYQRFEVKVDGVANPATGVTTAALKTFNPDIVISLGGTEFIDPILKDFQTGRSSANTPFYVLSPRNAFDQTLTNGMYFQTANYLDQLMAGVNYASVEDSSLYDSYLEAIQTAYPGQEGLESRENLYDAAYFMMYALAAANFTGKDFDGDDVVNGMKAIVDPDGAPATVGPGKNSMMFQQVLLALKLGGKVALTGTLGPPDFNPLTGARKSPGSVWCIKKPGTVFFDKLRLFEGPPASLKQAAGDTFCNLTSFFP